VENLPKSVENLGKLCGKRVEKTGKHKELQKRF